MVRAIEQYDQSIPRVLYTNAFLWNPERGIISDKNTLTYPTTLRQTLFLNTGIQGAAAIFNRAMCQVIEQPLSYYAMHDHVLLLAGICFGEVHYLHESLMYYRQHEHNVTGNAPGSIAKKIALMWENREVRLVNREHYEGLKAFYERFEAQMKGDDKQVVEAFLAMPARKRIARMRRVMEYRFKLFDSVTLLLIKMILRKYM
jgi:rhamnosyltransferase